MSKQVRNSIPEASVEDIEGKMHLPDVAVLDVREPNELNGGIIPGAISLACGCFESKIKDVLPDKQKEVIVYCATGIRSILAAETLMQMGYENVKSLSGGFNAWKAAGKEFEMKGNLSRDQATRYARHIILPEIGVEGQLKLLNSKVLLIGAGGLGSPAGIYLAAAGVGTLGIVDADCVDRSNLQRQILHREERIGQFKTKSARETIISINSDIAVIEHQERLGRQNAMSLIKDYDVIVDGCDNFPTRYLVNDACILSKKPLVDGSILRFQGQITVVKPNDGPCYRCIYPKIPTPEEVPSCAEAGVLGAIPGIIGTMQALEAIKVILDIGDTLVGRLLIFDGLTLKFRELKVRRDPECVVCSEKATIK